jgi:hypothetical protein
VVSQKLQLLSLSGRKLFCLSKVFLPFQNTKKDEVQNMKMNDTQFNLMKQQLRRVTTFSGNLYQKKYKGIDIDIMTFMD